MKELEENIINLYAEQGKQWLANLPGLVTKLEITYGLSNLKPFNNLSYHYLLSGFQDSQAIALKLGLDDKSLKQEAHALKAFSGFGTVKLLAEDEGMLLLTQAIPGVSLRSYFPEKDHEALQITCNCLKKLHQAPLPRDHHFPHVKDWLTALHQDLNIPHDVLNKARSLGDELISTADEALLLHGDLHQDNILQNGNDWIVIDPKGVIGETAFEVAAFIRNPMPELLQPNNAPNIIHNRIKQFAKTLNLSEQRIIDWCYVQAVLAWAWTLEDGGDETYFKKLTELFNKY